MTLMDVSNTLIVSKMHHRDSDLPGTFVSKAVVVLKAAPVSKLLGSTTSAFLW